MRFSHRAIASRKAPRAALSLLTAAFLFLSSTLPLHARINHKPGYNSFSAEQDIELGRDAVKEIEKELTLVNDAAVNDYINRLGQKLVRVAPGHKFPYTFKVVNSKELNAFALPGGPIYIHTAIITSAANEAQLAGVMAHEISHIALRHSTNQASKAMLAQAPLAILGGVLSGSGIGGQLAQMGIGFGLQSTFLRFSRGAETQSDEQGAQMLYDAGYDPKAMADFFAVLEKASGGRNGSEFFASHPNPGNRLRNVTELLPKLGAAQQYAGDGPEFAAIKARAASIPAAPDRKPAAANQPAPSSGNGRPPLPSKRMKQVNTEWFRIDYPDNWQVFGEGTSTVTIVPPEGVVQVGQSQALAYGSIISIFEATPEAGRRLTLETATGQLVRDLQKTNADRRPVGRPRTFKGPDGAEMMSVSASGRSPLQGQSESNLIVTTFRPEGLWYVVFIAPEGDYRAWEPSFQQMLNSLRFPR
jgi:Zn-dependent protease with chaperone function